MKISTGLRNHLLATGSLKSALDGGVIRIYAGTEPTNADDSLGAATLLCTITESDSGTTGLTLDGAPVNGVIVKDTGETWSGTIAANGTASFYRFSSLSDTGASSTTEKRVQGTVGVLNADLLVSSTAFVSGAMRQINGYSVGMPAS